MDIQILIDGQYKTVERNIDPLIETGEIKKICMEFHGTENFKLVYSQQEVLKVREKVFQAELDGNLFDLLLDDVLPALNSQLPEATQNKVLELLNQRAAIKAQYPKPTA